MSKNLKYMCGFGNDFSTEVVANTLPPYGNTPQNVAHGLYTEQISGTSFTTARSDNKRTWMYRILPSVKQGIFTQIDHPAFNGQQKDTPTDPNQMRWSPFDISDQEQDFITGIRTLCQGGHHHHWAGLGVHIYTCNRSMSDTKSYFYSADGEFLIVPQMGGLILRTEMGIIDLDPSEIAVIPKGVKFAVDLKDDQARGYICENYGLGFQLPDLGPIGANGLANPRDFLTPVAHFEEQEDQFTLKAKFDGYLWQASIPHSPLNVVAWHGNHVPYKYDLKKFCVINSVSFDHLDPSIFTVLTAPSDTAGVANIDFVLFTDRWIVAEDTFRPPYYHRNVMSEFMGNIDGIYDGKEGGGFAPGGASLHNCMTPHGPDTKTYNRNINKKDQKPVKIKNSLSFMFESRFVMKPTEFAMNSPHRQKDYSDCWQGLEPHFEK